MSIGLAELGITAEELQKRVVDKIAADLLNTKYFETTDEGDDEAIGEPSFLKKLLEGKIKAHLDAAVSRLAETHVLPRIDNIVDTLCLQETTKWGEKVGEPITFIEYLIGRAESYLTEQVDHQGKSKKEVGGYSWSASQTRITSLVNQHMHYEIERAMKKAVENANKTIVGGISEAVKIKLEEISAKLKVNVETR